MRLELKHTLIGPSSHLIGRGAIVSEAAVAALLSSSSSSSLSPSALVSANRMESGRHTSTGRFEGAKVAVVASS